MNPVKQLSMEYDGIYGLIDSYVAVGSSFVLRDPLHDR